MSSKALEMIKGLPDYLKSLIVGEDGKIDAKIVVSVSVELIQFALKLLTASAASKKLKEEDLKVMIDDMHSSIEIKLDALGKK